MTDERLTWKQITEKYPAQWVGLIDIIWEDGSNVQSAIVSYVGTCSEMTALMADGKCQAIYTTPDRCNFNSLIVRGTPD